MARHGEAPLHVVGIVISRDKLFKMRSDVKHGKPLTRDQCLSLIDHGIQALVEMAGGQSVEEQRAAVVDRERQVKLAISDVQAVLAERVYKLHDEARNISKARYMLDLIQEMLGTKGPLWHREWAWYKPRVDEEFGDNDDPVNLSPLDRSFDERGMGL